MRNLSETLRQLKAVFHHGTSEDIQKIYADFFQKHEEAGVPMLHREDLYMPGGPHTHYSAHMVELIRHQAGHRILDIGCGTGVNSLELTKRGFECVGIEPHEPYVAEARKHIEAYPMRAEKLDFPDKSFDTAIMIEVLEHVDDPHAALAEVVRVTRKNFILSVPNLTPLHECVGHNLIMHHFFDSSHVNFFTRSMLERFLKGYFPQVDVGEFGQFFNLSGKKLYYHLSAVSSL
ncbi:MAG: class I SAM-dependent methyltransferase [Candidatus Omnitrophota bacterium]